MFHDVQMGGLQGVLTSVHFPPSAGYPQHTTADPPEQQKQHRDVRMQIMRGPFAQWIELEYDRLDVVKICRFRPLPHIYYLLFCVQ